MMRSPVRLKTTIQEQVWGGRKLATKYGKGEGAFTRIGESWESCEELEKSSILLKWIDTDLPTSAHVHPGRSMGDRLGYLCECEDEIWVIVEAEPESRIGIGFNRTVTREEVLRSLHERTLELLTNNIEPNPGDCFVVQPGTIHYIDGGVTLLEISSKRCVTLRLYDWLRDVTTNRSVHVAESLTAMNFEETIPICTLLPNREEAFCVMHDDEEIELSWREIENEMTWKESNVIRLISVLRGDVTANQTERLRMGTTILVPKTGLTIKPVLKKSTLLEMTIRQRRTQ